MMSVRPDVCPEPQLISVGKYCDFFAANDIISSYVDSIADMNRLAVDADRKTVS